MTVGGSICPRKFSLAEEALPSSLHASEQIQLEWKISLALLLPRKPKMVYKYFESFR